MRGAVKMEARVKALEEKTVQLEIRQAVADDRIERTHKDNNRFFKLLDDHMREEDREREKDRLNVEQHFQKIYSAITGMQINNANKKGVYIGVSAAVSVFWIVLAFAAKVAGWI